MFDFGFNELLLLSILIIILFGPKELPIVLRSIHNFFSKLWVYSKEIRTSIESLVNEVDISEQQELKKLDKEINKFLKTLKTKVMGKKFMSEESIENSKAPLIEHFIELRKRILRSICVLSFTFLVAFIFSENIYLFLVDPYEQIMGENSQMIYTAPQEFLIVKLKIALFGALLITFPYFCLEIYSFIAPGL